MNFIKNFYKISLDLLGDIFSRLWAQLPITSNEHVPLMYLKMILLHENVFKMLTLFYKDVVSFFILNVHDCCPITFLVARNVI